MALAGRACAPAAERRPGPGEPAHGLRDEHDVVEPLRGADHRIGVLLEACRVVARRQVDRDRDAAPATQLVDQPVLSVPKITSKIELIG